VAPAETIGRLVYELGNRQWELPRLRELLEKILPQSTTMEDFQVEHGFETIGRRIMLLNARRLRDPQRNTERILLAIEDITERRLAEDTVRQKHAELQAHAEELARFNRAAVGRETRMIELKKEVNELRLRLGEAARYPLEFEHEEGPSAPKYRGDDR
jgi:chemotaxis protein methyltransferase CheR